MPLTPEQEALKQAALEAQKGSWARSMSDFDVLSSPSAILTLLAQVGAAQGAESVVYAPKFDEAEFNAMVERGTKAWAGVPGNWLEVARGNVSADQSAEILTLHRQLAAEKLRADQGWERYEAANRSRKATENQLAAIQRPVQAAPDGWISVKDRLPDKFGLYLVAGYHTLPKIHAFTREGKFYGKREITHWMPLPALPPTVGTAPREPGQ